MADILLAEPFLTPEPIEKDIPPVVLATIGVCFFWLAVFFVYLIFLLSAPVPRTQHPSSRTYAAVFSDLSRRSGISLPSWFDHWRDKRLEAKAKGRSSATYSNGPIDSGDILLSVVIPAYNEETRLPVMLEEAVAFLREKYQDLYNIASDPAIESSRSPPKHGWELLVVSDGSTDDTVDAALDFAEEKRLFDDSTDMEKSSSGTLRVISLDRNLGKGGAVRHGLKFARGQYVLFADADGASPFHNITQLMRQCVLCSAKDPAGRAIAIGSRADLVNTKDVAQRSVMRNFLMRAFHLVLRVLTPPETSRIRDTQCGFKLITRPALPFLVPFLHFKGWIFDVEMLMLAERAKIPMHEHQIMDWKEIQGSKLNVFFDSMEMAWNLIVLRGAWLIGVYQIR